MPIVVAKTPFEDPACTQGLDERKCIFPQKHCKARYYFLGSGCNKKTRESRKKSAQGLVGMKYEMRQWSTAVTLRLSRLSREDIRQLFRLEQIRFACCIQSSSYRRLKEVDQLISCNNTFDPHGSQGFQKQTSDVLHFRSFEGNGWREGNWKWKLYL